MIDIITSTNYIITILIYFRKECVDDPGRAHSCKGWKDDGFCKSDSEHYLSMAYFCKKTCGYCNLGNDNCT